MHNIKRQHYTETQIKEKLARETSKIKHYNDLSSFLLENKQNGVYNESLFKKTTDLLEINPEFYTIWNYRRDLITHCFPKDEKIFNNELKLTLFLLKQYPKVYWIWNHRVWLLLNHPISLFRQELLVVNKLLELDERNFHGWHYRRILVEHIDDDDIDLKEFEYTTLKINKNFSNFSAWHNRTKLVAKLIAKNELNYDEFITKELDLLQNAMYTDPEDQSIWLYLRWLLTNDEFNKLESKLYILEAQLDIIKELNTVELDDNGVENNWCLKLIILIERLISDMDKTKNYKDEISSNLKTLTEIDPLRANVYKSLFS